MTNEQIMEEVDKAINLGRRKAYWDIYIIVSSMYTKDKSESLKELLNILRENLNNEQVEV